MLVPTINNKEEDVVKLRGAVESKASELIAKSRSEFRLLLNKNFTEGKISQEERGSIFNELEISKNNIDISCKNKVD